jgi:hypothetical protein
MFPGLAVAIRKRRAAQQDEEGEKSPLDSRAEHKQRARDRAADSRRIVSEIGLLAFFSLLLAGGLSAGIAGSPVPVAVFFPLAL